MINTAPLPPDDDLEERRRQLVLDDLATWASDDNDVTRYHPDWNKPATFPNGATNPHAIPVEYRPYVKRSAEHDAEILAAWPFERIELVADPLRPLGLPIVISRSMFYGLPDDRRPIHDADREEHLLSYFALVEAIARKQQADADARERQLDVTHRRCVACGTIGDTTVKPRKLSSARKASNLGPRLCDSCARVLIIQLADDFAAEARELGQQLLADGARRDVACAAFLVTMKGELR